MARIAIDMFAVELGLSVLMQFEHESGPVTVLADAGSKKYNVHNRLDGCLPRTREGKLRIDLMIGTHYDGDHLNGLVDVINREDVEIGEAWLPPVANDAAARLLGQEPQDRDMLGLQLAGENGPAVLRQYLSFNANICNDARALEYRLDEATGTRRSRNPEAVLKEFRDREFFSDGETVPDTSEAFFEAHLADAYETLGVAPPDHAALEVRSPMGRQYLRQYGDLIRADGHLVSHHAEVEFMSSRLGERSTQQLWAHIRASAAGKAIKAKALANVVNALKKKGVNTSYRSVDDGKPRRFNWDASNRRFTPVAKANAAEPSLVLLGPSIGLINKHWDLLPIGTYAYAMVLGEVPYKGITESNELSYVGVFEFAEQRVLISGDAGCVDFKPDDGGDFYPELTAEFDTLDIVQIAHHAGHNAHFYNALLASDFVKQDTPAYLLLSHGTLDDDRPSKIFGRFIEKLKKGPDKIQLAFTSTPAEPKVRDFKHLIAPVAGQKGRDKAGDVKLAFDGGTWNLVSHQVEVA